MLSKISEIHVVCGLLKDFLRKLKEPLITFRLHRTFMEASGTSSNCGTGFFHYIKGGSLLAAVFYFHCPQHEILPMDFCAAAAPTPDSETRLTVSCLFTESSCERKLWGCGLGR